MSLLSHDDMQRIGSLHADTGTAPGHAASNLFLIGPGYVISEMARIRSGSKTYDDGTVDVVRRLREYAHLCTLVSDALMQNKCFCPDECLRALEVFEVRP